MGPVSEYYELALYKLGWTLYKQEFYEEALHRYMALLDYKVSIGYDFDQTHEEDEERRVADTFRVISLSFSNLGGPEVVSEYFAANGNRSYEDRVYRNLGEYYLDKLRYNDAAKTLQVVRRALSVPPRRAALQHARDRDLRDRPASRSSCSSRRRSSRSTYGLQAEYWRHFDSAESPEVLSYLKTNLKDLANHYHAQYQDAELGGGEARELRGGARAGTAQYLDSFPKDAESPPINYQLADLLLENEDFGERGARVRAHGLRICGARASGRGRLRRGLRAPRAAQGGDRASRRRAQARDTVASSLQIRRHVPATTSMLRRFSARPPTTCTT